MKNNKKTMKVTYFQNNFSKYQLKPYSLRFKNQELEKQYQDDRFIDGKIFTLSAIVTVICLSIAGSIQEGMEGHVEALSLLSVNTLLHVIALFKIKSDQHHFRSLIFILNVYSTFCYSVFLSTIEEKLTVGQIIFLEDIYVYSLILFMKTHTFIWDMLLILASRIIILLYSVLSIDSKEQIWDEIIILSSFCTISGILQIFSLFKNEKLRREAFLNSKQREQWNLIVDEVLPINVIISKYNSITGEISLNASNQEAQQNFKVQNDESFNFFMQKIRLDSPNSKKTLRDFILEKHHSIALQRKKRQDHNIKPMMMKNKQFINDIKSLQEHESQKDEIGSISPSRIDRNPSIKKMITQRSIVKKKASFTQDNSQKFVEILKGYYCEDWENKPMNRCQYKIQVFQFSVNEPLLLINVENNQEQENIKILKTTKSQYRELFKDTLYFFQDRIVRLSTEIGQVAIPISQSNLYYDLKYSLMSVFTGIHNILDFVFERGVSTSKEKEKEKEKEQTKETNQKKDASPQKPKKKDSFYQQISPQNSIENELNIIENGHYSFHGKSSNNSQHNNANNVNNNVNGNGNANSNINSMNSNLNINSNNNNNNNNNINVNNRNVSHSKGQNSSVNGGVGATMGNTKIRSFSLRKLLNEVCDVMFEKCKQKKIMFFFSDMLGEEIQMIQDQRRVKQVLFNYLQNALDCIHKGYIAITVRPFTNLGLKTYRFEIMDSGPGVNEAMPVDDNNTAHPYQGFQNNNHTNQMQVVSLRKKSQNQQRQLRKLSSFSNYFQNITTANPQSKIKGLGIGMKVNQKVIAKLGPYFPKIYSEQDTGTHIVYELYADIMAIRNIKQRYRASIHNKEGREEDVPEDEEIVGLSCYKYTRNEVYHFSKNTKASNLLLSPDSTLAPNTNNNINNNNNNLGNSQIPISTQQHINYLASTSNYMPSVVQSLINLNTPIIIPSNVSTIPGDNFNQSMPLRTPSSLLQVEPPSRHRPESMDNALSMKVTRSNQFAITTTQQNNSFTLESFRSRDRSRQDSFFADMNNRKRLLNQPNQLQLNLNGSDDGNIVQNAIYYNGSYSNPNHNYNPNPNLFNPYKKYSLHDLSNYS